MTSLSDGTIITYDLNGNMIRKSMPGAVMEYFYDKENRLIEVKKNTTTVAQFLYDGDGGRVQKTSYVSTVNTVSGGVSFGTLSTTQTITTTPVTTKYVGEMYEESGPSTGSGSVGTKSIYFGSQKVAMVDTNNSSPIFLHGDHLGSTNVTTNASGVVQELIEYEPFGKIQTHKGANGNNRLAKQQFTGKKLDDETGLVYFGARYYDPSLGRFITPDTIVQAPSNPQTLNRYTYCNNNPINLVDPSGHKWSWGKFFKSFVSTFVQIVTTVVLTPYVGPIAAGAVGGFLGGAINAGLNGSSFGQAMMSGLVGAGIGALGGGAFGSTGVNGFLGSWGPGVGIGLFVAGAAYSGSTGNLDSFSGGIVGFIGGGVAGKAISNAFKSNPNSSQPDSSKTQSLKTDLKPKPQNTTIELDRAKKIYENGKLVGAEYKGKFYPARVAKGGEPIYRVFGGEAGQRGSSWMPADPRNVPDLRNVMGIPDENSMGAFVGGRLRPGANYVELPASRVGNYSGGGVEFIIDNPKRDVAIELIKQWDFTRGE